MHFTETTIRENISDHLILHIATHGSFVPGNPEDSFLVLGNGQKLSISAIKSITDLANTHLVVLSACETGKGGIDKEGIEVAGLGHYFLLSGAKSVLASLWLVNDPATSLLMNRFYTNLSQGNLSKAEALRQVQIAFINGKLTDTEAKALNRAGVRLYREGQLPHGSFAHPYYWAPFILIGNGR
jgi:CHAT domain-containing protein